VGTGPGPGPGSRPPLSRIAKQLNRNLAQTPRGHSRSTLKMVIKSPYKFIEVPEVDIPTFLFETDRPKRFNYPRDRPLFIDARTERSLSLDQVHDQSRRLGQGLKEQWGWKKGDVLCNKIFSTTLNYLIIIIQLLYFFLL